MIAKSWVKNVFWICFLLSLLTSSVFTPSNEEDRVRQFTRADEFDFTSWTIDATLLKVAQLTTNVPLFLDHEQQRLVVFDYLHTVSEINRLEDHIQTIYSDPTKKNPDAAASVFLIRQKSLIRQRNQLSPLTESILQLQISDILNGLDLATLGQPIPPILYHTTPLPYALIISPRSIIQQNQNISLTPDLTLDEIIKVETETEKGLDVSALIVPVGGIGTYPTMVMNTPDIAWLVEVVSHEWTHNYLTLRPLGINYGTSNELRTMNETTANIAGKEIAILVLEKYYPEFAPQPTPEPAPAQPSNPGTPPVFDYRAEMHTTRVEADRLLELGQVEQAEQYMEKRRKVFWDNGYLIRKLNQAYFAFYGAYADVPGGTAGEDPVGPAVTQLRNQSSSLLAFLQRIAAMTSFSQLQDAIKSP